MQSGMNDVEDLRLLGARLPSGRRGGLLLARKYEKPEKIGSIYVNPAWKTDNSRSLWEVVRSSPEADETLGTEVEEDWILVTAPNSGVLLTHDSKTREVFLLTALSVLKVVPWTRGSEGVLVPPKKILVRMEEDEETAEGGLVVVRAGARNTSGEAVQVGEDVAEVSEGDRVFFSRHSGVSVEVHGSPHLIIDEDAILAVLPPELQAHDLGGS